MKRHLGIAILLIIFANSAFAQQRVRDLGVQPGILTPGQYNAITDVAGVKVGHQTLIEGDSVRTGVTVILPHDGNVFQSRVPAAVYVGNGFGKAVGFTQIQELGELETPIGLTNTLSVYEVAAALADYTLRLPGNEQVGSVNAVAGETNDGWLNEIRARVVRQEDVFAAIANASGGVVAEGNVGAGTGTRALGFKAGIGTSSRVLPESRGGYTVGVLVQSNFGGILEVVGVPVGVELGNHYLSGEVPYALPENTSRGAAIREDEPVDWISALNKAVIHANAERAEGLPAYDFDVDGSVMIIVATDAPLTSRNLERLARRAFMSIAKVGGFASNGSGDYVIAFSTHPDVRIHPSEDEGMLHNRELANAEVTPLFLAAVEATEEALLNSLFMAESMSGTRDRTMPAIPIDQVKEMLRKYGRIAD
ncbi:MAG: P1 family peptidase [Bacteroidetes bacterium]|nr:P1 family peptidase [Bacteroidota bacterium]